ncbi:MAG: hypothetical protein H7289_11450 [Mucilaginibacter sp.]|nr:hypothetical protein [Mucilaginibacter sp.]
MVCNRLSKGPCPSGAFFNWMKEKGKLGGQHKVPRLANNREYVDAILKVVELVS